MQISDFFPEESSRENLLKVQHMVAKRAIIKDDFKDIRFIAAADQAFLDNRIISGIVLMDFGSPEIIECAFSIAPISFPYIPTFLSFREGPAIVNAFGKLKTKPDLLLIDGAGINHPRGAGLATHIGVALDVPTAGITKKKLCGEGVEPSNVGEASPLVYMDKTVGWLLKSRQKSKPIVVAPGHRVSLESSLSIVKACLRGHKLPEPARLAHEYANMVKREQGIKYSEKRFENDNSFIS
ncbi:MAG: endonuclease V [Candidatus Methanoperedenaceae archaeon]|nr:endonuclease V [Candidatus Methanoperedenaceae archaeon]MDW7727447.1 endonuclease V [Candidatus Methanoperedens sp.]